MQIIANNIQSLSTVFDNIILLYNNPPFKSYGHVDETSLIYIQYGIYNKYNIIQDKNIYTFEYVCGDRLFGYKILNIMKFMIVSNEMIPLEKSIIVEHKSNIEELFLNNLTLLDNYIFKSNTIEYITQLSMKLFNYLSDEKFCELYKYKYEYIMYEKIEQYLRYNSDNNIKIISLFNLINVICYYCPLKEYKDLLSKYVNSDHKYVQHIANDMLM